MQATRSGRRLRNGAALLLMILAPLAAGSAGAVQYPVSGTITVNGTPGSLPTGAKFSKTAYDTATGDITPGVFTFPAATTSFVATGIGTVTVTYQLSQTNASGGLVAPDGVAALDTATMKLQILTASIGVIPIGVGTCVFQPIVFDLAGTASAAGLDLADASFVIPPVGNSDCGNWGSQINAGIAGNNNSIAMQISGDFTPPTAPPEDAIFHNGFEAASRAE